MQQDCTYQNSYSRLSRWDGEEGACRCVEELSPAVEASTEEERYQRAVEARLERESVVGFQLGSRKFEVCTSSGNDTSTVTARRFPPDAFRTLQHLQSLLLGQALLDRLEYINCLVCSAGNKNSHTKINSYECLSGIQSVDY